MKIRYAAKTDAGRLAMAFYVGYKTGSAASRVGR